MEKERFYKKIRIFVASPGDVVDERAGLIDVVREINQTGGIADQAGVLFEVLDWRTHAKPAMGRPEDVILEQIPVSKWDLFIGILWSRFGTPPGVNPKIGEQLEAGTEEEFLLAYDSWKKNKRPQIHVYRCTRSLPYRVDPAQMEQINSFFKKFEPNREYEGLYFTYKETPDFLNQVQRLLNQYVKEIYDKLIKEETRKKVIPGEYGPGERIDTELKPDVNYEMVFLRTDMRSHSRLKSKYSAKKLQDFINNFHHLVYETAKSYGGDQFMWAGDGGIMAFWGKDAHNRAVLSGIKLLNTLPVFNLDNALNPLDESIEIRIAAHSGDVIYSIPRFTIFSDVINDVVHLEQYATIPGTFAITDALYFQLKNRVQEFFLYDKDYQDYHIYIYKGILPQTGKKEESEEEDYLEKVLDKIDFETSSLLDMMRSEIEKTEKKPDVEKLRRRLEEVYKILEKFHEDFSNLDKRWAPKYLQELQNCLSSLIDKEDIFYKEVERLCLQWRGKQSITLVLVPISNFMGHIRRNSIPFLKILLNRLRQQLSGEIYDQKVPWKIFIEKIENLVNAEDLDEEIIFIELFMNFRIELIDYIIKKQDDNHYNKLLERLWKLADFVLLEDITLANAKQSQLVFRALADAPGKGKYFKSLLSIINWKELKPHKMFLKKLCKKHELEENKENLDIILKCMLLYPKFKHQTADILEQISVNDLWNIIAYYKTHLRIIFTINKYITENHEAGKSRGVDINMGSPISTPMDLMKVFFELVHARLQKKIETLEHNEPFRCIVEMVINFFKFDFFVCDGYFHCLDNLRLSLIARKRMMPQIETEYLNNRMRELEDERNRRKNHRTTSPEGVLALPLPIQRRLAKSGFFNDRFIESENVFIYEEAAKKIKVHEIVIALKRSKLLANALSLVTKFHSGYFQSSGTLLELVLNNPKCDPYFGQAKLKDLGKNIKTNPSIKNILRKISNNRNANPEIRTEAFKILNRN